MNSILPYIFCLFSLSLCSPISQQSSCGKRSIEFLSIRIIGGRTAQPGEFPWQVAIEKRINHTEKFGEYCGGSILSQNTILTAAHCFHDEKLVFNKYYLKYVINSINTIYYEKVEKVNCYSLQ